MKNLIYLVVVFAVAISLNSCKNSTEKKNDSEANSKVIVYYFHGEQRCATCIAVQDVTKATLEENFKDNKDVSFQEIDITDSKNEELVNKYEIAWSTLLIVCGEKTTDITDDAFATAKESPELLKKQLTDEINNMLNN
jgi:thiol-disulfide isomerase/thioredoxin